MQTFKNDYIIIGLINSSLSTNEKEYGVEYISYNKDNLKSIFINNKIDFIVNVATKYFSEGNDLLSLIKTNLVLPLEILQLARKYNVKAFLNADTFFNNPKYSYTYLPEYILSKKQVLEWILLKNTEKTLKIFNMKIFHMYGKNDSEKKFVPSTISKIKNNQSFIDLTKGEQKRDFIFIDDVASAFKIVLESYETLPYFENFQVGTGKSTSIRGFVEMVKDKLNSTVELRFGKVPYRKNEIMDSKADNKNLTKLGWKIVYDLDKGLLNVL